MTSWLDTAARARVDHPGSPLHGRVVRVRLRLAHVEWKEVDLGPLVHVEIRKDDYLLPPEWLVPYKPKARKRTTKRKS